MNNITAKEALDISRKASFGSLNPQLDKILSEIELAAYKAKPSINIETGTADTALEWRTLISLKSLGYTVTEFTLSGVGMTNISWEAAR